MNWLIVANSNLARIYAFNEKKIKGSLQLIRELQHPASRKKNQELVTDRPGRYQTSHQAHGSYFPLTEPARIECDTFAREVAKEIDHGRATNRYNNLVLIGLPRFLGYLGKHLSKHCGKLIQKTLHQEHTVDSIAELETLVKKLH